MIDVFNSTMLTPMLAGQQLDIQVADGIALDALDKKWEIDGAALNAKIAGLPIFAADLPGDMGQRVLVRHGAG